MHLNENYEAIRGQILLLDPLPTVNRAYSMVERVDTQRKVTGNITANREVAANVTRASSSPFEESEPLTNAFNVRSGSNSKGRRDFKKNKSSRYCDHCQRSGHTTDQCFKIIGYPDWYQGPRDNSRPKKDIRAAAHLVCSDNSHDTPLDYSLGSQETNKTITPPGGKVDSNLVQALAHEMMRLVKGQTGMDIQS